MTRQRMLVLNFILLAACLCFFFLVPLSSGPIRYEKGSQKSIEKLQKGLSQAEEPFFTELLFSGERLPFDKTTSTFYLPLNMETAAWETGVLESGAADVELLFAEDFVKEDKQEAIREGRRFSFYAVRGNEYQECGLVATGLPILAIETAETADIEVFGGMVYFWEADRKINWTDSNILEAHIRGNTSRTYPKKGYKLSLKKQDNKGNVVEDKKSLFGLREDDEWILNAMYSDDSKIRDKFSADVWNSFGSSVRDYPDMKLGTDFVYVEVFFNQEYWGLYGLMEPIDSKQLKLDKSEEPGLGDYSYKSITPQNIPSEELDSLPEYGMNVAGFELKGNRSSVSKEDWEPLFSYLKLLYLADDETFRENAPLLTDVEGALNVWIYLQAALGIDNRGKNMYYVAKRSENAYRMYFAPWDMDLTWGDRLTEGTGDRIWNVDLFTGLYSERINWTWGDRLIELDVEGARERVEAIWSRLRKTSLSDEAIKASLDGLVHRIQDSGALRRNEERWPDSDSGADYGQFERLALYRFHILDYYFHGNLEAYMGLGYE